MLFLRDGLNYPICVKRLSFLLLSVGNLTNYLGSLQSSWNYVLLLKR